MEFKTVTPELLEQLQAAVPGRVHTGEDIKPDYSHDEMPIYGQRLPDAVVECASTQEVAAVCRLCYDCGVPIIPRGAGTGLCGGCVPLGAPDAAAVQRTHEALAEYERLMHKVELHSVMSLMDEFIRYAQKLWADGIKEAGEDEAARTDVLRTSAYLLWACALMMHPIVPAGCELIGEYLGFDPQRFFSWDHGFCALDELCDEGEAAVGAHGVRELPPRFDFFEKHPSQFK